MACWRACRPALTLLLAMMLGGCVSLDYYLQAAGGQLEIWRKQQSIASLLARPDLDVRLRAKLELVERARHFAAAHLALPDHGSYRSYADLQREYVVWNVFAAPELSLTPRSFCYPLLGCLDYRGFFSVARAAAYADALRAGGDDTFVGGVAAYSTLGWLNDPVLNTVLRGEELRVVDVIFHELAHQKLYVAGDTTFNESFAMAVARAGLDRWLGENDPSRTRHVAQRAREQAFLSLVQDYRQRLAAVYSSTLANEAKRTAKARLYAALYADYETRKAGWGGDDAYDTWMNSDLNNAKLASLATYHEQVDAFLGLLARCAHDFPRFYRVVARLGALEPHTRAQCLSELGDVRAPGQACARLLD